MNQSINSQIPEPLPKSKTLLVILIPIIATAIVISGGFFLWQKGVIKQIKNTADKKITEIQQQFQEERASLQAQITKLNEEKAVLKTELDQLKDLNNTANWQTYSSQYWGFSFKYPNNWIVIDDKLPKNYSETSYGQSTLGQALVIGSGEPAEIPVPSITLYINPEGWGAYPADKRWKIEKSDNGFTIVSEIISATDADPNYYRIRADNNEQLNRDKHYFVEFIQSTANQQGWDDTAKAILATFQFTQ